MRRHKGKMHDYLYNFQRSWWGASTPPPPTDFELFNAATGTNYPAIETLINALKSAGVWNLMTNIYPFVGDNATANAVNLRSPGIGNMVMGGTEIHSALGINTNGSVPQFAAPIILDGGRTFSAGIHVSTFQGFGSADLKGVENTECSMYTRWLTANAFCDLYANSNRISVFGGPTTGQAHFSRGSDGAKLYFGSSLVGSNAGDSSDGLSVNNWAFGDGSTRDYGFLYTGRQMSDSQVAATNTAIAAYCTSMGR